MKVTSTTICKSESQALHVSATLVSIVKIENYLKSNFAASHSNRYTHNHYNTNHKKDFNTTLTALYITTSA